MSAVGPTQRAQRVIELDDRVAVELAQHPVLLAGLVTAGRPIEPGTVAAVADAVEGAEPVGPMPKVMVWSRIAST